jgi:hypothetical protein
LLFIAVKHAIAAEYIPRKAGPSTSNTSSAKCCADAARRNSRLCQQLLESNQASAFSTLDYHYAFTAAIALLLARLVPEVSVPSDEENVNFLSHYLLESGDRGNESARDCAKMVREFGAFVSRLLVDHEKNPTPVPQSTENSTHGPSAQGPNANHPDLRKSIHATHAPRNSSANSFDFNTLPEGQSVAYQQIFSWFQENQS